MGMDVFTLTTCLFIFRLQHLAHSCSVSVWGRREYVLWGNLYSMANTSLNVWLSSLAALVIEVLLPGTGAARLLHRLWNGPHKCTRLSRAASVFLGRGLCPSRTGPAVDAEALPRLWACSNQCTKEPISTGEWGLGCLSFASALSLLRPRCSVYPTCSRQHYLENLLISHESWGEWSTVESPSLVPSLCTCFPLGLESCPALASYEFCHPQPCVLLSPQALGPPGTGTGWILGGRRARSKAWLSFI